MKQAIKDYFSYSRKEMIGVFSFVLLLLLMAIIPTLIPEPKNAFAGIDLIDEVDSLKLESLAQRTPIFEAKKGEGLSESDTEKKEIVTYFYFDPNTISDADWKKLGVKERAVSTINKYKAHGGIFKRPEDILKLYGISEDVKKALLPYVKIQGNIAEDIKINTSVPGERRLASTSVPKAISPIDINKADTAQWESLPGIGSKLAARIVKFRDRLGGFESVAQVAEVCGIPDSTFQRINPMLAGGGNVKKININTADETELSQHPYLQFKVARAIIQYRKEHGPFKNVDEISKLTMLEQKNFLKVKSYLVVE